MSKQAKEKGKRLVHAMNLARFNRHHGAEIAGVSFYTYKGWELGVHNGIPKKQAQKLIAALKEEGVICSLEWLMNGEGEIPYKISGHQIRETQTEYLTTPTKLNEKHQIQRELNLFRQNYPQALELVINDDAMEPHYSKGDLVAGEKIASSNYKKFIGKPCLVKLENEEIVLRQLQLGNVARKNQRGNVARKNLCATPKLDKSFYSPCIDKDHFTLVCTNPLTKKEFALSNIKITALAPILWHRRKMIKLT